MNPQTYRAQINKAIRPLGVKVVAGKGYSYFKSLKTGDQIGDSVMTYRQTDLPLSLWVESATQACVEHRKQGFNLEAIP